MGKRSLATPLRWLLLCGLTCTWNKPANCQSLMGHHFFTAGGMRFGRITGFCSSMFSFLNRSFWFSRLLLLNGFVSTFSKTARL